MLTGVINLVWLIGTGSLLCFLAYGAYRAIKFLLVGDQLRRAVAQLALYDSPA